MMDIQLPGMDGLEITRKLKQQPATADIPVVAVTSFAMTGDREKALAAGCAGYVTKPIDKNTFIPRSRPRMSEIRRRSRIRNDHRRGAKHEVEIRYRCSTQRRKDAK